MDDDDDNAIYEMTPMGPRKLTAEQAAKAREEINRNVEKQAADRRAFMRRLVEDPDLASGMLLFISEISDMPSLLRAQGTIMGIHLTQVQIPQWDAEIENQLQQIAAEEGGDNGEGEETSQ
jgi:hypothetical protein